MTHQSEASAEEPKPPIYEIRELRDFLQVPKDRRADCLEEFQDFLDDIAAMDVMLQTLHRIGDGDADVEEDAKKLAEDIRSGLIGGISFMWIDDGERGQRITVNAADGEQIVVKDTLDDKYK